MRNSRTKKRLMQGISLNLVVIRTADLTRAEQFYRALGLAFTKERHGMGPEHWAAELGPTVFEIYPADGSPPAPASTRLGFRVPSVDVVLASLAKIGAEIV